MSTEFWLSFMNFGIAFFNIGVAIKTRYSLFSILNWTVAGLLIPFALYQLGHALLDTTI